MVKGKAIRTSMMPAVVFIHSSMKNCTFMCMKAVYSYFCDHYRLGRQSVLFKRALYLLLLFKSYQWLFDYNTLFGKDSFVYLKSFDYLLPHQELTFILYQCKGEYAALFFILPVIVLSLFGFFKFRIPLLSDFLLWFFVLNIDHRIYPTLTGGDVLLHQFLFYSSFISMKQQKKENTSSLIQITLHNFSSAAIIFQVIMVYLMSSYAKLNDADWQQGNALLIILKNMQYSSVYWAWCANKYPFVFIALNYMVLSYQVLFPALVWFPPIKKWFIFIGILMHLFIAFAMGLFTFGAVMIISYIYFWPPKEN